MAGGGVHQTTLLLVGDAGDRILGRKLLGRGGDSRYTFLEEETLAEALECACAERPACVVTACTLRDGTGVELLERLPRRNGQPLFPVVVLTTGADERVAVEAMKAGAKDCIAKIRVTSASLTRAVANAIERGRLEAHLWEHQDRLEAVNRDLARKNADIQSFYHTVSHELKTPLSVIREFVLILADGLSGPVNDEQRAHLHIVRRSCDRMAAQINDLLDSSRLENGKLTIHPEPTDLARLARDVAAQMEPLAAEKGLALVCHAEAELPRVGADRNRIQEVVSNLISNAIKFTPPNGAIHVTVAAEAGPPGGVRVEVADTGVGIRPDQVEQVFDRFFQAKDPIRDGMGGLGLGLCICKGLVELHGGWIEVESTPGEGSRFTFMIPVLCKEEGSKREQDPDCGRRKGPGPGPRDPVAVAGL